MENITNKKHGTCSCGMALFADTKEDLEIKFSEHFDKDHNEKERKCGCKLSFS